MRKITCLLLLISIKMSSQTNYINIVKNDVLREWKLNKDFGKILEQKGNLTIYSKEEGYGLITYYFSSARIVKGDVNNDGKIENIVIVDEEGGGAGGNVGSTEYFIVYNLPKGLIKIVNLSGLINPPTNDDGCYFTIEYIKGGFLYGTLNVCTKRGETRYDDVWQEIKTKCKVEKDKLRIVK